MKKQWRFSVIETAKRFFITFYQSRAKKPAGTHTRRASLLRGGAKMVGFLI
jgi:hypothetical protein